MSADEHVNEVYDAVIAALTALPAAVGDNGSPTLPTDGSPWAVVEYPPGGGAAGGVLNQRGLWSFPVRVRCVAGNPNAAASSSSTGARQAAQILAGKLRTILLTPGSITPTGNFKVTGVEYTAAAGTVAEGITVNVVDDYTITVSS